MISVSEDLIEQLRTVLAEFPSGLTFENYPETHYCPECKSWGNGYTKFFAGLGEVYFSKNEIEHHESCTYTKIARIIGESNIQRIK